MPEPADRPPSSEPFAGFPGSECGEHRPTGHRAWCYRDGEWCYPDAPCRGCELPPLRPKLLTATHVRKPGESTRSLVDEDD